MKRILLPAAAIMMLSVSVQATAGCLSEVDSARKSGDFTKAVKVCRKRANSGDLQALYILGVMSERGDGLPVNYGKAADFYQEAATGGLPDAMNALGILMEEGRGIPQNVELALQLFKTASLHGLPEAHYNLAALMISRQAVEPGEKPIVTMEIMQHLRAAAEQNLSVAQYATGYYCEQGIEGNPPAYEEALHWYTRAAENGDGRACLSLGRFYEQGLGTATSLRQAAYWYYEAWKHGLARGAGELGRVWQQDKLKFSPEELVWAQKEGLMHGALTPEEASLSWYEDGASSKDALSATWLASYYGDKYKKSKNEEDLKKGHEMSEIARANGGDAALLPNLPQITSKAKAPKEETNTEPKAASSKEKTNEVENKEAENKAVDTKDTDAKKVDPPKVDEKNAESKKTEAKADASDRKNKVEAKNEIKEETKSKNETKSQKQNKNKNKADAKPKTKPQNGKTNKAKRGK